MANITICDRCNKVISRLDPVFIISCKTKAEQTNATRKPIANKLFSMEVCSVCAGKIKVFVTSKK